MSDLIVVERVGKRYRTGSGPIEALHDVSLAVGAGEFCTLIGPSGCGKSTLLGMLGGLVAPDGGRVLVDGRPVAGPDPRRVATVFQDAGLFPWRTALENVEFGLELQGVPRARRRAVATDLLGLLGLRDFAAKYPRELSGGMRQRANIIRTLIYDPELILMDEPFGPLDAQTRIVLQDQLLKLWSASKKTIIFITHDLIEAITLADRVVLMSSRPGKIKSIEDVAIPRPRDVFRIHESEQFRDVYERLWQQLRPEVKMAEG